MKAARAGHPFTPDEAHRPAADVLVNLLEWIGRGDPSRHDEAARRAYLGEGEQQFRIRLFQEPAEGAVVNGDELVLDCFEHLAHWIARRPAADAGDRVLSQHRLAIVEFEPGPQPECPGQPVRRHLVALDHLALRREVGVHAVKHVPDQDAGVAGYVRGGPDRIEVGEISMGGKAHGTGVNTLRNRRCGKFAHDRQGASTGSGREECASMHDVPSGNLFGSARGSPTATLSKMLSLVTGKYRSEVLPADGKMLPVPLGASA
jgi:hypothetical protein